MKRPSFGACLIVGLLMSVEARAYNCPQNPDPECENSCSGKCRQGIAIGDPVNALSLDSYLYAEDIALKTSFGPVRFARRYTSSDNSFQDFANSGALFTAPPPFGNTVVNTLRWTHNFFAWATVTSGYIDFRMPSGGWRHFNTCSIPDGGTQCWATPSAEWPADENHVRRTTTGVEFFDEDGRIFIFDKFFPTGSDQQWFLGAIHDSSGRQLASVSYAQPTMLDGGACRMPTDAGMPGVPYVSRITSPDSTALVFTYDGVFNSKANPVRWECGLVKVSVDADAGAAATVAEYRYVLDDAGRPTAGYLASATMGSLVETYTYDGGFKRWRGGTLVAGHNNVGNVVHDSEGGGPPTTFSDPGTSEGTCAGGSPYLDLTRCCSNDSNLVKRRATQTTASSGDGTGQSADYKRTYYLTRPNDSVHSVYPIRVEDKCTPSSACSGGNQLYLWAEPGKSPNDVCENDHLAREVLAVDKRGNATYTPYSHNGQGGSYPYSQWEKSSTHWGRLTGTNGSLQTTLPPFLEAEDYTYRYRSDNSVQSLQTVTRNSTYSGGPTVSTELRYLGTNTSIVDAVFHSGRTQNVAGVLEDKTAAMFFAHDAGRVVEIQGPCFGASASACPSGEPVTRFDYYGASAGNASGRLRHVYRYPGGLPGSDPLVTEYLAYTPLGDPTAISDEDHKVHTFTWAGRELQTYLPPEADAGWTFTWENGELTSVRYPEGNYEVFCHRDDGTPQSGDCSGTWKKQVQFRAKAQDNLGAQWSERIVYTWVNDHLKSERRFVNGSNGERFIHYFDEDAEGRPTWERIGISDGGVITRRFFDGAGNLSGFSRPLNAAAPDFCGGVAKSVLCSWLEHDRANRPAVFDVYPNGTQPGIRTCIDYDAQSNVKRISTGCDAYNNGYFTPCDINGGAGASSSCSVPSDYQWDDFGNVVEAKVVNMGDGGTSAIGSVRYEFDARGMPIAKQTNEGTTFYTRDALGRLLTVRPSGFSATFVLSYDSAAFTTSGCGLTPPGQAGRLARVLDVGGMWETTYGYDAVGRLIAEYRRPPGAGGCPSRNTLYTYDRNGSVTSITYPHGRQVVYSYGTSLGLQSRVEQVAVSTWNGSAWSGTRTLASSVKWEPYGGLRGYQLNFVPANTYATVEYMLGDDSSQYPSGTGCDAPAPVLTAGTYDGTARLRSLRVSPSSSATPSWETGDGGIFRRSYTWRGDAVARTDTCYRSMTTPIREDFAYDNALRLSQVDLPNYATTGGYAQRHAFSYDSRNNREKWYLGDGGVYVAYAYAGGNTPDRLVEERPLSGTVAANRYSLDRDGRRNGRTWVDYSGNLSPVVVQSISHHAGTGPDTAISDLITPGGSYVYTYDLFGRRTQKSYPNYDADKFIYSPRGVELLEDVGVTTAGSTSSFPIDDYVWLGGRPIAQLRGKLDASGGRTSPADFSRTTCERLSDGTPCDYYFPITDHIGKPVLMLDSSRSIAGVGEAEPFGRMNTVETWQGNIPSTSAGINAFSSMSQPTNGLNLQMRPLFHTVDLEYNTCGPGPLYPIKGDWLIRRDHDRWVDGMSGSGLKNHRMSWINLTPYVIGGGGVQVGTMGFELQTDNQNCPRGVHQSSCTPTCSPATAYSGVQTRQYEYRRFESVAKWGSSEGSAWKQSTTYQVGWEQPSFKDGSWTAPANEGSYGGWPWYTSAPFPSGTTASWIWNAESRWSDDYSTVYFRKKFTATGTQAIITLTADNSFTAYFNGVQIAAGVDWWVPIVVTVKLTPGSTNNTLAIVATNAGGPGGILVDVNETTTPFWTPLRFPGQYYDAESDLHYNGYRFYDPAGPGYLQPEPILRSPYSHVAYAYAGVSLPAYAYAGNNPVHYVDLDGRRISPSWQGNAELARQVGRFRSTPSGRALWNKIDAAPELVTLDQLNGGYHEPLRKYGILTGVRTGRSTPLVRGEMTCRAITSPIYEGLNLLDPAGVIGHELTHAELDIFFPGIDNPAERDRIAYDFQYQIQFELSDFP